MPLLISLIFRSRGRRVALFDDPRDLSPAMPHDAAVAVGLLDHRRQHRRGRAGFPRDCASSAARVWRRSNGTSPESNRTTPFSCSSTGAVCSSAWPVPSCGSWVTNDSPGCRRGPAAATLSCGRRPGSWCAGVRLAPRAGRSRSSAVRRRGAAPSGCDDFMRVPLPAARMTTWRSDIDHVT